MVSSVSIASPYNVTPWRHFLLPGTRWQYWGQIDHFIPTVKLKLQIFQPEKYIFPQYSLNCVTISLWKSTCGNYILEEILHIIIHQKIQAGLLSADYIHRRWTFQLWNSTLQFPPESFCNFNCHCLIWMPKCREWITHRFTWLPRIACTVWRDTHITFPVSQMDKWLIGFSHWINAALCRSWKV